MLELVRPFARLLPDVEPAKGRVPFAQKAIYTAIVLAVFLVCSQLPLYGVRVGAGGDPFYWVRVIMASSRGSTMELGISPIVSELVSLCLSIGFFGSRAFSWRTRASRGLWIHAHSLAQR